MDSVLRSWKTTLAGAGVAAFHVIANGVNWKSLIAAALIAAWGAASKDHTAA